MILSIFSLVYPNLIQIYSVLHGGTRSIYQILSGLQAKIYTPIYFLENFSLTNSVR